MLFFRRATRIRPFYPMMSSPAGIVICLTGFLFTFPTIWRAALVRQSLVGAPLPWHRILTTQIFTTHYCIFGVRRSPGGGRRSLVEAPRPWPLTLNMSSPAPIICVLGADPLSGCAVRLSSMYPAESSKPALR